jgi:heme-degrading monooxygenase HmoA
MSIVTVRTSAVRSGIGSSRKRATLAIGGHLFLGLPARPASKGEEVAMNTTTIDADAAVVTLINVFEVRPEKQAELVRLLDEATVEVMRHLPGFVSANIHRSLDGARVANYAQWATREDFQRMLENPAAQVHMRLCTAIANAAPVLYEVSSVHR